MWSIIGGTGFEKFEDFKINRWLDRKTPFGETSSGLGLVEIFGKEVLYISRHGQHHEVLPSEVNYRANIFALKKYGATKILSISSVGSLKQEYAPGDCVVPDQYIDRTKGIREHSFCGGGIVGHVSLANPVDLVLFEGLKKVVHGLNMKIHFGGAYVTVEGPYYSTKAESHSLIASGGHVIGMTNFPEYGLAREAGMSYLPLSFITDYDCWNDSIPHVTLDIVNQIMQKNKVKAFQIIERILKGMADVIPNGIPDQGLKNGLMTARDAVPTQAKAWLDIILK